MYLKFLQDEHFFALLYKIDMDLMKEVKDKGCSHCQSRLHVANYTRKARRFVDKEYSTRFSLCCSNCRARAFVPSTLFFGRFVYGGVFFVIISSFLNNSGHRYKSLERIFGISKRTLARWKSWWNQVFIYSSFWKEHKARVNTNELILPKDFIELFADLDRLFKLLAHFK